MSSYIPDKRKFISQNSHCKDTDLTVSMLLLASKQFQNLDLSKPRYYKPVVVMMIQGGVSFDTSIIMIALTISMLLLPSPKSPNLDIS